MALIIEICVAKPIYNLHSCHHIQPVPEPIGQWQKWLEKEVDMCGKMVTSINLILICSSAASPFNEHSYGMQISSHSLPINKDLSTCLLLRPCHQFCQSWPSSQIIEPQPVNCYAPVLLVVSPARENKQPGALVKVLPAEGFRSPLSRGPPERSCGATAAHFGCLDIMKNHP